MKFGSPTPSRVLKDHLRRTCLLNSVSSYLRFPMSFASCVNVPPNGFEVFGYGWTSFRVRSAGVRYLFRSSLYWASRLLKYDTHLSVCISGRAFLTSGS